MQKAKKARARVVLPKVSLPHRLARLLMLCLVPQLAFQTHPLLANPTGGTVAAGSALIESTGNTMTITTSDRAVIHWQGFSIGAGETTQFVQPSSSSAVLNRVTSGDASHLLGNLQANGQVYLLNPNGIFIGNGAVINVGSFLATTANIADTDFMKGGNLAFSGATDSAIINQGSITATAGDVMLLARTVKNTETGTISAPQGTVAMAAGTQFYLKKDEIGAMRVEVKPEAVPGFKGETGVDNSGLLQAMRVQLEADGNLYGLAINQQGLVRATGVSRGADGTIVLSAPGGTIRQSGTM
ncbi:MAG: filamentous hemagglutinin N-terminal domain-containing protein, partial [Verrucomicrobia bacterium]|nr:filamentous hemagglutinin N-terminal domain-containing protein [Verrucomicrobiota bacterium]